MRADVTIQADLQADSNMSPSIPSAAAANERLSPEVLADYLVEVGAALVRYGCPSYRIEEAIKVLAETEGLRAESFALPTGVFLDVIGSDGRPVHRMARVKEWTLDLGHLTEVDEIFNDVAERGTPLFEGLSRVRALEVQSSSYPQTLSFLAQAAVAGAGAIFFGGGLVEIAGGALCGLLTAISLRASNRRPRLRLLGDLVGAMVSGMVAWVASIVWPATARDIIVLAGVIALVPGMTFTTALAELVYKNLVSGAARLMEAFVTFLSLVTGVGMVLALEAWLGSPPPSSSSLGLPFVFQFAAVGVAGLGFSVLFSVPRRFIFAAVVSALLGWGATRLVGNHGPAYLVAFVSSLVVGLYANALARLTQRPAQLFQLPGMMLLVPGSFGFIGFSELMRGDLTDGAQRAIAMVLVAGALVMGVLVANALLRPRKLL
jgi:uncharacterized membrane protein YjjP (DUF1212 family)